VIADLVRLLVEAAAEQRGVGLRRAAMQDGEIFRGQLGVSLTFIEEMYARNVGNLFVSPLRLYELVAGQLTMSVVRALIGVGGACLFAWILFRYSIFSLGLPLVAFFFNLLMFGWAIGLAVSAMILRWGLGAEELAWAAIFLFAPVSGVYYPIAVLPAVMQWIAWCLPSESALVRTAARAGLPATTRREDGLLRVSIAPRGRALKTPIATGIAEKTR